MEEVRTEDREGSVISSGTEQGDENDEGCWRQLRRELEDIGVTPNVLSHHRKFIVSWFQKALAQEQESGQYEPLAPARLHGADQQPRTTPRNLQDSAVLPNTILDSPTQQKNGTIDLEDGPSPRVRNIPIDGHSLLLVSERADVESVVYLLRNGVNVNYHETDCMTALNVVAMRGYSALTQLLLKQPGIKLNEKNHLGHTPLSLASWYGHLEVVQLLLDNPATTIDPTDEECGQTPLSLATEQGNTPIVQLLLAKGANPNSQDNDGRTPLSYTAEKGRPEEAKLLLAANGILPNLGDKYGLTPLAHAVESGNDVIVRLLLSRHDVDMNAADVMGSTPFDRVMRKGYHDMVFLFEQAKATRARYVAELISQGHSRRKNSNNVVEPNQG